MIRYALVCKRKHEFEAWFQNSADYDRQTARGLVACPTCGTSKIDKAIMAPAIARGRAATTPPPQAENAAAGEPSPVAMMSPQEREFRRKLKDLREHITGNADYVGKSFPEEARKIHYGETEQRSIYGEASPQEAESLREEGIEFHPLPVLPDDHN
jgi:hypothetical protein